MADSSELVERQRMLASDLRAAAPDLARRWVRQSSNVTFRSDVGEAREAAGAEMIRGLADGLDPESNTIDGGVARGLAFGMDAFEAGLSLHQTLKTLELLGAMALFSVESAAAGVRDLSFADGVRVTRRLQHTMSRISLAAAKGFTQAVADDARDRFRSIRHDLRNPLGTIKNVLAMMDDESLPAEARSNPRFRVMAERNAKQLDEMIMARLSDSSVLRPGATSQETSLRDLGCAVRRELRTEAQARGVAIVVGAESARVLVDAAGVELVLHAVLEAALQEARSGEELCVDFPEAQGARVQLVVETDPQRPPVSDEALLERLSSLAAQLGVKITTGERIELSVAAQARELSQDPEGDRPADRPPPPLADVKPGNDVSGASQRDHGKPSTL